MYSPCEFCIYGSLAYDWFGHEYYQCDLDDNPDNQPDAECSKEVS